MEKRHFRFFCRFLNRFLNCPLIHCVKAVSLFVFLTLHLSIFNPLVFAAASNRTPSATESSELRELKELKNLKLKVDELSEQVKKLKKSHVALHPDLSEDSESTVRSFLSSHLTLGGFFESGITGFWGPDTRTQISTLNHTLGLNFAARFSEEFRFVGQIITSLYFPLINVNNAQRKVGSLLSTTVPAQGYAEYTAIDLLRIQAGLGYVPFGIAFQQRELVLFVRRGGPQLMRTEGFIDPFWTGIHLLGSKWIGHHQVGYNAYTFTPFESPGLLGTGLRVWWSNPQEVVTVGVSSQIAKRGSDTTCVAGIDMKFKSDSVTVLTEVAQKFMKSADSPWAAYIESNLPVFSDNILFYAFLDYANSSLSSTGVGAAALADPYRRVEYGGGFNWLPTSYTRFRIGLYFLDYVGATAVIAGQNRDFTAIDASVGVAF